MSALTREHLEFGAALVTEPDGPLQSCSDAFFLCEASRWAAFGAIVEAMRKRGWQFSAHKEDPRAHVYRVRFRIKEPIMGKPTRGEGTDAHNIAKAALLAAFAATGGEA